MGSFDRVALRVSIHFDTIPNQISLCETSDVWIIVSRPVVVEVTIGIKLLVRELTCVIAGACLIAYRIQDVVLIPDKDVLIVIGEDDITAQSVERGRMTAANKKGKQRIQLWLTVTCLLGWLYADTVKFHRTISLGLQWCTAGYRNRLKDLVTTDLPTF